MKRFLALFVVLLLLLSAACAEVKLPEPPPTQLDYQQGFLMNILQFILGTDLDTQALNLEVTDDGQAVLNALLQRAEALHDLDITVSGMPVHVQFGPDALAFAIDGQVYRLPYENLEQFASIGLSGDAGTAEDMIRVDIPALGRLLASAWEDVIAPAISIEEADGIQHFRVQLAEAEIIALGDMLIADEQFSTLLSAFMDGADIDTLWPPVRAMIEAGQLPVSITADIALGEGLIDIGAEASLPGTACSLIFKSDDTGIDYNLDLAGAFRMSGKQDLATGASEFHMSDGGGFSCDTVYTPTEDGWSLEAKSSSQGTVMELRATDAPEAFDGALTIDDPYAPISGDIHVDKAAGTAEGHLQLPDDISAVLNGHATDDGFEGKLDISQGGTPIATVSGVYTETEELASLELTVDSQGAELATASLAYAKETGAYALRLDAVDDVYVDAKGIVTDGEQTCTLEYGQSGEPMGRCEMRCVDDTDAFRFSASSFQDVRYDGVLRRVLDVSLNVDKWTGGFTGAYREPMRYTSLEAQGILSDSLIKIRLDGTGRAAMRFDFSCLSSDDSIACELNGSNLYGSCDGSFLWSPCVKSLAFYDGRQRFNIVLNQDDIGLPRKLHVTANYWMPRPGLFDLVIDENGVILRDDRDTTVVTGGFRDMHTYVIDIVQNEGSPSREARKHISATADPDQIVLEYADDTVEEVCRAVLSRGEKTEFEPIIDSADAIEVTPELVMEFLMQNAEVGEEPAPTATEPAPTATETAPAVEEPAPAVEEPAPAAEAAVATE